jgi:hypothetical protein
VLENRRIWGFVMEPTIYSLGGLRIDSDFPLPGLQVCGNQAEPHRDIVIRSASISDQVAATTATFLNGEYSGTYNGSEFLLDSSRIGRFLLRAGREILMDLAPSSNHLEVRSYLLGAVFGALCHQRGITPLHASAIDVGDGCVTFVGASGAGKSTVVASLAQRGHDVITDDECFLQIANNEVQAWPGITQVKLWEDSLNALAISDVSQMSGSRKYYLPVHPARDPLQSRRLRGVYQLHRISNGRAEVTRLKGADALETLMRNVYPPGLADCLGYQPNVFIVCAAAARTVPVFRFSRPWNLSALNQSMEIFEDHLSRAFT